MGFLSMDRCCQSQLIAESAGQMERISDEVAELTKSQVGSESAMGKFSTYLRLNA